MTSSKSSITSVLGVPASRNWPTCTAKTAKPKTTKKNNKLFFTIPEFCVRVAPKKKKM